MIEIKTWSVAPKEATELVRVSGGGQRWRNPEKFQYWEMNGDFAGYYVKNSPLDEAKVLATRPKTDSKTVADAYEAFPNGWLGSAGNEYKFLNYCKSKGWFFSDVNLFKGTVCSYEQFKAYAKEQEAKKKYPPLTQSLVDEAEQDDEKWTHECYENKCRILIETPDAEEDIVVLLDNGSYCLIGIDDLKPINPVKPKLTKKQQDTLLRFYKATNNLVVKSEIEKYLAEHSAEKTIV